jgi:hypothetical protein
MITTPNLRQVGAVLYLTDNKRHILLRDGLQTAGICPFNAESDYD